MRARDANEADIAARLHGQHLRDFLAVRLVGMGRRLTLTYTRPSSSKRPRRSTHASSPPSAFGRRNIYTARHGYPTALQSLSPAIVGASGNSR